MALEMTPNLHWQVLPTLDAPGEIQMAIDQWLLTHVAEIGRDRPAPPDRAWLRFYRCIPTAITLGCFQRVIPDRWRSLRVQGQAIALVRRPTGGRAVLHSGDLCYSLVMPRPRTGRRLALYCELCQFLIAGWQTLGVTLQLGGGRDAAPRYQDRVNCFATSTGADLVDVQGHKAIGSALRLDRTHLLQQGSMIFRPDPGLTSQVFGPEAIAPTPLASAPVIAAALGPTSGDTTATLATLAEGQTTVIQALTEAAIARWGGTWIERSLTATDWEQIRAIAPTLRVA
jgi:lipoate-protein ligase A